MVNLGLASPLTPWPLSGELVIEPCCNLVFFGESFSNLAAYYKKFAIVKKTSSPYRPFRRIHAAEIEAGKRSSDIFQKGPFYDVSFPSHHRSDGATGPLSTSPDGNG
jgi:hypothetical protein